MRDRIEVPGASRLPPRGSIGFVLPSGRAGFLVRTDEGALLAFENRCPHWNVDLDLGLGDFVDPRTGTIVCRNHGAEFVVESGLCVHGPCAGDRLTPIPVVLEAGTVFVEWAEGSARDRA